MVKIRWRKIAPGSYIDSTGRFVIAKDGAWFGRAPEWNVTDHDTPVVCCDSLKSAKKWVDDLLDSEAKQDA